MKECWHALKKYKRSERQHKLLRNLNFSSFELAVDSDFIRKNPAKGAMVNIRQDVWQKIPLSEHEIKRLMDFCSNNGTYSIHVPFLIIAIGACLRCGEPTGVTWSDRYEKLYLSAHILRHTGNTLLATGGMGIKALQNVMGHSEANNYNEGVRQQKF